MKYPRLSYPVSAPVSQYWGQNPDIYEEIGLKFHNGIDFSVPVGTDIRAAASGWVREAGTDDSVKGFGKYIKIMSDGLHCVYAHLSEVLVKKGDNVVEGQVIGKSGNTGFSTGPHLHFGVRVDPYDRNDGVAGYCNPLPFLQQPKKGSALAPHWIPTHKDGDDYNVMKQWQSASVKMFENGLGDPDFVSFLYDSMPNGLVCWRDWPLSEQKDDMIKDPYYTGQRHAKEWIDKYRDLKNRGAKLDKSRTIFLGINEPPVWTNLPEIVDYNVAFMEALEVEGFRAGVLNLSVGWPANTGPDTPPDWSPYQNLYTPLKRGGHILFLHEYWDISGPEVMWGWWAGRLLACNLFAPIIVGECGIDRHVQPEGYDGQRGWQGHMSSEQYFKQLARYETAILQDARIHSLQVFSYDVGNPQWNSFDVRPSLRWDFVSHAQAMRNTLRPGGIIPDPPPVDPPVDPPTNDLEDRVALLEAQMMDLREAMIGWAV